MMEFADVLQLMEDAVTDGFNISDEEGRRRAKALELKCRLIVVAIETLDKHGIAPGGDDLDSVTQGVFDEASRQWKREIGQ